VGFIGQSDPMPDLWSCWIMIDNTKTRAWLPVSKVLLLVLALVVMSLACSGGGHTMSRMARGAGAGNVSDLPDISSFLTRPSDHFLVDLDEITGGHPFKGAD
jgi:hypothetical protein